MGILTASYLYRVSQPFSSHVGPLCRFVGSIFRLSSPSDNITAGQYYWAWGWDWIDDRSVRNTVVFIVDRSIRYILLIDDCVYVCMCLSGTKVVYIAYTTWHIDKDWLIMTTPNSPRVYV